MPMMRECSADNWPVYLSKTDDFHLLLNIEILQRSYWNSIRSLKLAHQLNTKDSVSVPAPIHFTLSSLEPCMIIDSDASKRIHGSAKRSIPEYSSSPSLPHPAHPNTNTPRSHLPGAPPSSQDYRRWISPSTLVPSWLNAECLCWCYRHRTFGGVRWEHVYSALCGV